MSASQYAPLDLAEHNRQAKLLRALHCAYPVTYEGKQHFIQVIHARLAGGRVEMEIYLTGDPTAIESELITIERVAEE